MSKSADRISVDSDQVALAAKKVGSHAEDVRVKHEAAHGSLNNALHGCELSNLSQRWATTGARHGDRIDALSRHVGETGKKLTDEDAANAALIVPRRRSDGLTLKVFRRYP